MHARYGAITLCGGFFQNLLLCIYLPHRSPTTPSRTRDGLASSAFARHYLRNHCCFLFLPLIRCFSSGGWQLMFTDLQSVGFPHSDTPASTVVCTSPGIFAAYHVLRRLQEPRHPPCALSHFHLLPGHIRPSNIIQASLRTTRLARLLLPFYFCFFQSCQ